MMTPTTGTNGETKPVPDVVHWAYLVGGSPDVFRDMRRHLMKAGINICGHAKMEAAGADVVIPRSATVVLCATDASRHAAVDAARHEARKRGIPCVLTPFRHWSICSMRLAEAGITRGSSSIFGAGAETIGVRKFQAILESATPTVSSALIQHEVRHPTTTLGRGMQEEVSAEFPAIAEALGIADETSTNPLPAPADKREHAIPPSPPVPTMPKQDITPTFHGDVISRVRVRSLTKTQQERLDYARKLIINAKGNITNADVREAQRKLFDGVATNHDTLNHLRVELGYKPHGRGGKETEALSPSAQTRLVSFAKAGEASPIPKAPADKLPVAKAAPPPAPPEPAPVQAAPPPPPPAPAPAPASVVEAKPPRDVLMMIGDLQEELRARGIWGVMIEAAGTFTFQRGK